MSGLEVLSGGEQAPVDPAVALSVLTEVVVGGVVEMANGPKTTGEVDDPEDAGPYYTPPTV